MQKTLLKGFKIFQHDCFLFIILWWSWY